MRISIIQAAFAGLFGTIFGLGLILAGMTNPARVIAFLDVTGDWNPSLALVMGSAIIVAAPAFAIARRGRVALLGGPINLPIRFRIDRRLVAGAVLFGLGWGLSGICPGPGIVLLGTLSAKAILFVGAVIVGMRLTDLAFGRSATRDANRAAPSPDASRSRAWQLGRRWRSLGRIRAEG